MVSTIDFFNVYFVSQSTTILFIFGPWSLNTYFSITLLWMVIWTSTILTKALTIFTSTTCLFFIILLPLSLNYLILFHGTPPFILLTLVLDSLATNTFVHPPILSNIVYNKPILDLQIYNLDDFTYSYCTNLIHCLLM
jgi:hypothetical protein